MIIYKINIPNKPQYNEIVLSTVMERLKQAKVGDRISIEVLDDGKPNVICPCCGASLCKGDF